MHGANVLKKRVTKRPMLQVKCIRSWLFIEGYAHSYSLGRRVCRKSSVFHHFSCSRTATRSHVLSFVWSAGRHVASADVPHGIDVVFTDGQAKRFPFVCFTLARVLEVGGTLRYLDVARLGPNVLGVGCIFQSQ